MNSKFYRLMDKIFDPLPKELKKKADNRSAMLYYQSQDESYTRYKHRCYRNLLLKAILFFFFGLLVGYFLKLV